MTDPGERQEPTVAPTSIDVDRQAGVTLTWDEGEVAWFGLAELRDNCPCAGCYEKRRGEVGGVRASSTGLLKILDARLVGAFGIAFDWSDGHCTGIFTWEMLRRWSAS